MVLKHVREKIFPHLLPRVDLSWIAGWLTSRHIKRGDQVPHLHSVGDDDDGGLALW